MPRLPQEKDDKPSSDFEVLLTGFGPFGPYASNPSWESVKQLHIRTFKSLGQGQRKIRVQSINLPVLYHSTLDTIPRLHGLKPSSPHARADTDPRGPQDGAQGRGSSYPEGWQVDHPVNGFDLIIHVGVGAPGGIKLEQQAHKMGYHLRDAFGLAPPPATMLGRIARVAWTLTRPLMLIGRVIREALSLVLSAKWMRKLQNFVAQGGFGRGYEPCSQLPRTDLDVYALVEHLRTNGHTVSHCWNQHQYRLQLLIIASFRSPASACRCFSRSRSLSLRLHLLREPGRVSASSAQSCWPACPTPPKDGCPFHSCASRRQASSSRAASQTIGGRCASYRIRFRSSAAIRREIRDSDVKVNAWLISQFGTRPLHMHQAILHSWCCVLAGAP